MASYNKVLLMGNLTRDPDVRYTPKGMAVADIGLAVNRYYTADNGEKREETTFVDVTLWGRQAEVAGQYLKKGRPVLIEGRLQMDTWDDKQTGQKRSKLKVVGETMQLIGTPGGRGGDDEGGGGASGAGGGYEQREQREYRPSSRPAPKGPPKPPADPDLEPEEDDIPF